MPGLREGVQPELEPDNTLAQAHRLQALPVRAVPQGVPAEGGPAPPQGDPAHGAARHRQLTQGPTWWPASSGRVRSSATATTAGTGGEGAADGWPGSWCDGHDRRRWRVYRD
uniref:(northern house mosquito) hypothetical protein n=1 Tax=Culex pipiens TaxID=7175 RepID=A0A8D8DNY6_CULPI